MSSRLRPTEKILSDKEIRDWGVHIVWDFEYKLLDETGPESLFDNIQKSLKTLNSRYFIYGKPTGYGKIKDDNRALVLALRECGFQMNNVVTKTVKCAGCGDYIRKSKHFPNDDPHDHKTDVADIEIVKDMVLHAIVATAEQNMPCNILLVTNDNDFTCTFEDLRDRGFTVMAAVNQSTYNTYGSICGNGTWIWKDMQKGARYISRV